MNWGQKEPNLSIVLPIQPAVNPFIHHTCSNV